jgi:quinol monooxygenase YgiN
MILSTIVLPLFSGRVDDVISTIRTMLEPTRVQNDCLECRCSRDVEDVNTLYIIEKWATEAAFRKRVLSKDYCIILAMLEQARRPPEISIHHISSTEGIGALHRVREEVG